MTAFKKGMIVEIIDHPTLHHSMKEYIGKKGKIDFVKPLGHTFVYRVLFENDFSWFFKRELREITHDKETNR